MADNLKTRTIKATAWQLANSIVCNVVQLIMTIILARYIMPEQYGAIAIALIVVSIAQTLANSGLGMSLIRKTDRTEIDCSTVFYYNLTMSIVLYLCICPIVPVIADYYNITEYTSAFIVLLAVIPVSSLGEVPKTLYSASLNFKTLSILNISSTIIAGIIGIVMAIVGYGIWALVIQYLTYTTCSVIALWIASNWHPTFAFSFKSLKDSYLFGSRLMLSKLLDTVFRQLYSAVIGKLFTALTLGLYNRAETFANMTSQSPSDTLSAITFPALCRIKDDEKRLRENYRRILRLSAFIIFPICLGLGAITQPLVNTLFSDEWVGMIPLLQVLVFSVMWYPIHAINLSLLQVKGRSDLVLRLEVIKKTIVIITIIATAPFGIMAMCFGRVATSVIALFINTYYTTRLLNLSQIEQFKDIKSSLFLSSAMYIACIFAIYIPDNDIIKLAVAITVGLITYIGGAKLFRFREVSELRNIIRNFT